jgi:hypothetical protein
VVAGPVVAGPVVAGPVVAGPVVASTARGQLQRDAGRAGRDVEDHAAGRDDVAHHLGPPSPVLPEREEFSKPVVPGGEPVEQVTREAVGVVGHEGSPGAGAYYPTVTPRHGAWFSPAMLP